MTIAANHFFSLMAHPFVDHSLIDTRGSTVGSEAMSEYMPAFDLLPLARENFVEIIVSLIHGQWSYRFIMIPAPWNPTREAKRMLSTRMDFHPLEKDISQTR